ncbi:MAG: hypothetical protein HQ567_05955 [Candidatus Nealsonbacteria bacterium]|nr:hypothetical protein [Candidatus Nealsonbacteria bacterium]
MSSASAKRYAVWLLLGCLGPGCGGSVESPGELVTQRSGSGETSLTAHRSDPQSQIEKPRDRPLRSEKEQPGSPNASPDGAPGDVPDRPAENTRPPSLGDLLKQPADSAPRFIPNLPRMQIDEAAVAAAGIRKLSGKRLTLYTDLPTDQRIDQLPGVFDLAFPQWCEYFGVDASKQADWQLTGFLIKDKARFQQAGLLPGSLPPFRHGFARNFEFWLYDQPSDYYRRHLLLHEGTHGFMNTVLGGCGPAWYMEGIAELLSTHRWEQGKLTLNHMPANREEVAYWGRIKIIKDAVAERRPKRLKEVIDYPPNAHLETEPYAWCWAAAALMDRHPRYQERFRRLHKNVLAPDFDRQFYAALGKDWDDLREEWQILVAGLEYGHDVARTAVDFTPGKPLPAQGGRVTVAADRGWQNSGLRLDGATTYRLVASGRYQVASQPQIWWCEPGGVSIRYYRGRPLGILLAAVRPDGSQPQRSSALLRPMVVGLATKLSPQATGTLYLKINDSAAEFADNAGQLQVEITRE